jgi:hypothetical protein
MESARDPSRPFAAFSVARVRNDGMTTVLGYEAPAAVLVSQRHAAELPTSPTDLGGVLVQESSCYLEAGDALVLMSDGITQAGLGGRLPLGWQTEGDDCTVAMALCRRGQIVNVMTGPPADRSQDTAAVRRFMQQEGLKIVCGGTTAEIVSRTLKRPLRVEQDASSLIAPPRYEIDGIDLVTEGAVTLNQVYNVLDEGLREVREDSGVTELCALLQIADRVNVFQGTAKNQAAGDISFRQRGILTRDRIVRLLVEKLQSMDKLVATQTL